MSVTGVGSTANIYTPATPGASTQRAADGDYKTASSSTSQVKDSDGDYKAVATAQAKSAPPVQAAINNIKHGG
jgi:hypothetical protein